MAMLGLKVLITIVFFAGYQPTGNLNCLLYMKGFIVFHF